MSRYEIAYAPVAEATLKQYAGERGFRTAMASTLGRDPYGHGSRAVGGERDRREATVAGVFIRFYVAENVVKITVVRMVPAPCQGRL
ncbi:hypothetical protein [Streptomyces clavuligerus]|uniref:Type II toxin-antitoxin system RelE/ParE family toxin n=1 Tax=Streptomyces clavuligerus TaxID=1901 RepID=B5GZJ6_STRCL|nr:hypothetical protein [Streptomyces clavuligerus]EDY51742.1 hypothetical protein SSCG_04813 [Streptomyces clavuligerus]EFG03902.1 Hypothetical protein SCLAV_p0412 [Streptomyces clavuligerus]MBY6307592.1 hypothetical protein [Streptomyces clavuligerus]QCS09858.1 hypothetical protein CRV15_30105 [Streptomyces clavuligerus]QPJ98099.1 hypothetical protein GE265_34330 [Streptomyces clavuligerus]